MERRAVFHAGRDAGGGLTGADIRTRLGTVTPGRRRAPRVPPEGPVETAVLLPGMRGDQDLNPDLAPRLPLREAAVLVGLIEHDDGPTILLTRRNDQLTNHAGQISFPGGRIDPGDSDPEAAALREAREEVGLDDAKVSLVGRLDTYVTRTGYEVVPVVALLRPSLALEADPAEVAEIFELPLDELMRPGALYLRSRRFDDGERWFYAIDWQGRHIWGATAGMLNNLAEILGTAG
ncbi:MAG: CoA pyrophosphatase [Rhodospirillaceae bacterium]|nr:CoA pyrophosphatase [Rhodospirillaceae bacterium]